MLRVVVPMALAGLLAWWWAYRRADAGGRAVHRRALWLLVGVVAVALLWRVTGIAWLAAAAGGALAILRALGPWLLRALPFLARFAAERRRAGAGPQPPPGSPRRSRRRMGRAEALEVLGLGPDATREEITAKYRKLIRDVHPDHGGSEFLTRQLNEARDVLLDG